MTIEEYRFGRITIDNKPYGSDLKIIQGTVVPKWWRREGHRVTVEDVEDVLAAKPRVFVVGTGQPGRMRVDVELAEVLGELGIELVEEPTDQAVRTFNRLLRQGISVAAAFHLTC